MTGSIWLGLLLGLGAWQGLVVAHHPRAADVLSRSVTVQCGGDTLTVAGYGGARPEGSMPTIAVNGRSVAGESASALQADLGDYRTVYRLTARCSGSDSGIILYVYAASRNNRQITYRVGRADIIAGRVVNYTGLTAADEDTYWFE